MSDGITRVTTQSFHSRLSGACKSLIFAPIFLIGGIYLLIWNEGNSVMQHKAFKEGIEIVISIDDITTIDNNNEGNLIHVIGTAEATDDNSTISDDIFGISPSNALKLKRTIETYQWVEESHSSTEKKAGGSTETTTTYSYKKAWKTDLIDSSTFAQPDDHTNPDSLLYQPRVVIADPINVGAFVLSNDVISRMNWYEPLTTGISIDNIADDNARSEAQRYDNGFYFGSSSLNNDGSGSHTGGSPSQPMIGDTKVTFQYVREQKMSIIGRQTDDSFSTYTATSGGTILLVESGPHDPAEMFRHANQALTLQTWMLRLGGMLIIFFAIKILMGPMEIIADCIPCIGNLVEDIDDCIALLLSSIISTFVIALAWLAYRPILSFFLFGVIGGLSYWGYKRRMMKKQNRSNTFGTHETIPVAEVLEMTEPAHDSSTSTMGGGYKDEVV